MLHVRAVVYSVVAVVTLSAARVHAQTPVTPTPITPAPIGSTPASTPPSTGGPAPVVGTPASIEFRVVNPQLGDFVHPQYGAGSQLQLEAIVKDAVGNVIDGPASGCTPAFDGFDNQGIANVDPRTGAVTFGPGRGVFSVGVHCDQDPNINSRGHNHGPYNFETSESKFAHCDQGCEAARDAAKKLAEAEAAKASQPKPATTNASAPAPVPDTGGSAKKKGAGVGSLLLGAGLGYLLYKVLLTSDESESSNCPSASDLGSASNVCIPDECECPTGFTYLGQDNTHCTRPGEHHMCARNSHVARGVAAHDRARRIASVEELVSIGFATKPAAVTPRALVVATTVAPVGVKDRANPRPRAQLADTMIAHPARTVGLRTVTSTPLATTGAAEPVRAASGERAPRVNVVFAPTPALTAQARAPAATVEAPSRAPAILTAATLSLAAIAVSRYVHVEWRGVEVTPWTEPTGGGLSIGGRF